MKLVTSEVERDSSSESGNRTAKSPLPDQKAPPGSHRDACCPQKGTANSSNTASTARLLTSLPK